MKRKSKEILPPAKQLKEESETPPQFLDGMKCHIHPANFGLMRYKIFENHVTRYGGELVSSLPESSEVAYHVVFEESVDEEKLKRLVDILKFPNSVFLRCTWLVESIKAKAKAGTKSHLIVSMNSMEEQRSGDRFWETDAQQCKETDRTWLELSVTKQAKEINRTHLKQVNVAKPKSQRNIRNSGVNENPDIQNTLTSGDPTAKFSVHPTSHENIESQASTLNTTHSKVMEDEGEPEESTREEALANKGVTCKGGAVASEEDNLKSLIRPFPKNLQVIHSLHVVCSFYFLTPLLKNYFQRYHTPLLFGRTNECKC